MRTLHPCLRPALIITAALLAAGPAAGQPITVMHTFTGGTTDGKNPTGALLLSGSTLYGMTSAGGYLGNGTIFQIGTGGTGYGVMHLFAGGPGDGSHPGGSLIQSGATLYGMTSDGGSANAGTVFQMGATGAAYGVLHQFANGPGDGAGPYGTLVQSGSTLYGLTSAGGSVPNSNGNGTYPNGTIFNMGTDGSGETVLHSFAGGTGDGQLPHYGAMVLSGSTLYGATASGGPAGDGTVFKMNTDGTAFGLLHSFTVGLPGDGAFPEASVVLVGATLYGTTYGGGAAGLGAIFKVNTDGTGFGLVHSFAGGPGDGAQPLSDLLVVGSTLYGTTAAGGGDALGTLFKVDIDGSNYSLLHSFAGGVGDGSDPEGAVILAGSNLYGMTVAGGGSNDGVVYSFPVSVPEPSSLLLTSAAAAGLAYLARRRSK
jgi:uncharacterized repeat protein (TIGR03803 family)